ncbi:MAG: malto-oligosyltrehalose trehalohydrolase [Thermodesulfobacteriota bacterium]
MNRNQINLGADYLGEDQTSFRVWAPQVKALAVHLVSPRDRIVNLVKDERGYYQGRIKDVAPGTEYLYRLEDRVDYPDPASRFQPHGVHGPSAVVNLDFPWEDRGWGGLPLDDYIIYELHAGAFTEAGTLEDIIPYLDILKNLGVTALELMPVAQFPGGRNWGYDGVYPFAVQNSYGGPAALQRLVNESHKRGLAVILDVVYNHLGPEGNYLAKFGPYFTDRYKTPWGPAMNLDGPHSDEVRNFFIQNALDWISVFRLDALRIDAVHGLFDFSARTFLEELAETIHREAERLGRRIYLIAESDLNDSRLVRPSATGGYGLDGQWNDDFHHALHALLTEEKVGYYQDFGRFDHLVQACREGYVYSGQYSLYRRRRHGNSSVDVRRRCFVVFSQNHDQIGNRPWGDRLSRLVDFERLKLAAGLVLLSPFIPLLFMGEEYGEEAPFLYFVSHSDPGLIEAVRRGRREEFSAFDWPELPPDPRAESTFHRAKLNQHARGEGRHQVLSAYYKEIIKWRKRLRSASAGPEAWTLLDLDQPKVLAWLVEDGGYKAAIMFCLNEQPVSIAFPLEVGLWQKQFGSSDRDWQGPGSLTPELIDSDGTAKVTFNGYSVTIILPYPKKD